MRHTAGASALERYRVARARRRWGAAVAVGLLALMALAWWAALRANGPAAAWLGAGGAACLLLACVVRPRPDPERWLRGAAGETATAGLLDRLPARRWTVLHDLRVPGSRANIDHLVIGPTGLWVVDSKTTRARVRARWRSVLFGDRPLDAGPVSWEAQVVADRLGIPVRPLIVVHGEGLRRRGGRCHGVRVVPAAGLLRQLRRGRRRLGRAQVGDLEGRARSIFPPASAASDNSEKDATFRG